MTFNTTSADKIMQDLLNVLAYVGAIIAALVFGFGMVGATSAPQEAAISGISLVIAFVPYSLARIAGANSNRKMLEELLHETKKQKEQSSNL